MTKLFLDDIRTPSDGSWTIVRNYDEFVTYIIQNGLPDIISFDSDLHQEHIEYYFNNGGHANPPLYPVNSYPKFIHSTGFHCAKFLIDYCKTSKKSLPICQVHSANLHAGEAIMDLLFQYGKSSRKKIILTRISPTTLEYEAV